jgi:hypothetical protein
MDDFCVIDLLNPQKKLNSKSVRDKFDKDIKRFFKGKRASLNVKENELNQGR